MKGGENMNNEQPRKKPLDLVIAEAEAKMIDSGQNSDDDDPERSIEK